MSVEWRGPDGVEALAWETFEARVIDGELGPDATVRIPAVTGTRWVRAGDLELFSTLADPDRRRFRADLRAGGLPLVTAALAGVLVRIYLVSRLPGAAEALVDRATNWAPAVLELGEVWRLVTYGFLHLNLPHLVFNLVFLVYCAWNLERGLGRRSTLALFVLSVVTGGLVSLAMSPGRPSLGASGGDFGLLAAAVVFGLKHGDLIPPDARKYFGFAVAPYLVASLLSGVGSSAVDNWGHLGGLLGGGVLATLLEPDHYARHRRHNARVRRLAFAALALAGLVLYSAGPRLVPLTVHRVNGLVAAHPSHWSEDWTFTGDSGWFSPASGAVLVTRTVVYDAPQSPEQAVRALLEEVDLSGTRPVVVDDAPWTLAGLEGRRVVVDFTLSGRSWRLEAVVLPRGTMVHRAYVHGPASLGHRLDPLAERLFARLELAEPDALLAARRAVHERPRLATRLLTLGRAAAMAGLPEEAARALRAAYESREVFTPVPRADIAAALLDLHADYGHTLTADEVRDLVAENPTTVPVLLAAAGAWQREGRLEEARHALAQADAVSPGDPAVRRARARLGL